MNAICSGGITDFVCEQYYTKDNNRCKRTSCPTGEYLSDETCLKCPANATCNGVNATCNSGYTLNNNTCTVAHQKPVCEDSAQCVFSGEISGDWMLTIKGSTRVAFKSEEEVDIFVVGGGARGGGDMGSGGSGGYTKTVKNQKISGSYQATIGAGGGTNLNPNAAGGTTSFGNVVSANGGRGNCNYWGVKYDGVCDGNGGSGGGGLGCSGASDGGNGGCYTGTKGQGTTTRAFGESTGTLYAGGGGGWTEKWYDMTWGGAGGGANKGQSAAANTGGGGGGGSSGAGGSGIILIRNARWKV